MKEKMKKKIQWLKEHKAEILVGTGGLIVIGVSIAVGIKITKINKSEIIDLGIDLGIDKRYGLDLEEVAIKELGNVGKNFLAHIPEATEDTLVNVIAYIEKKDLIQ